MYIYDRRGYDIPFINKYCEFRVIQIEGLAGLAGVLYCCFFPFHYKMK